MLYFLLALVALAVSTEAVVRRREARAVRRWPPEGEFHTIGGVRMHAVVRGSGPPLVLIHGASGSLRDFTFSLLPRLAGRYRVIAVDRPGLGYSQPLPGRATLADQAQIIRQVAAVCGAVRPVVVGHSYGGAVALAWAAGAPSTVAGLVTLGGVSHPWPAGLPTFYRITSSLAGRALVIPLLAAWTPRSVLRRAFAEVFRPDRMPSGYAGHLGPDLTVRRAVLAENARQRRDLKAEIAAMVPQYGGIRLPVEIVHGTGDMTVDFAIHAMQLHRDLPDAVLLRMPGTGHMPHHAEETQVIAAIDRVAARALG